MPGISSTTSEAPQSIASKLRKQGEYGGRGLIVNCDPSQSAAGASYDLLGAMTNDFTHDSLVVDQS